MAPEIEEKLLNILMLILAWSGSHKSAMSSERLEWNEVFSVLKDRPGQLDLDLGVAKAFPQQGRGHLGSLCELRISKLNRGASWSLGGHWARG